MNDPKTKNCASEGVKFKNAPAPSAKRLEHVITRHSVTLTDDYTWLRAENWQEVLLDGRKIPAEIKAHLRNENAYSKKVMSPSKALHKALIAEMRARIQEEDTDPAEKDGLFAYFTRFEKGAEHPVFYRQNRDGGDETRLLDTNRLSRGKAYFEIGDVVHSPDHSMVAWSADVEGSEFYTIQVRNITTGRNRQDQIEMCDGSIVWTADAKAFYYIRLDESARPRHVMRHRLGTRPANDAIIYTQPSDDFFMSLHESRSGRFCILNISGHEDSEEWLIDLEDTEASARLVAQRRPGILYESAHRGSTLYIRTDADGADDFKIVTAPLANPDSKNWQDYIPYRSGVMIIAMFVLKDYLIRLESENGLPRIIIHELASQAEHAIAFDEEAYDLNLINGLEFDTAQFRFSYSSMTTPMQIYEYDIPARKRLLLKSDVVPSGHNPADYCTRRIFAQAADGETIPVSLAYKKGLALDGSAPCLLYAYGAYGDSTPPEFDRDTFSLMDRGFVYAIAHVRGGSEKGTRWYKQGKREFKINSFTDFIAVARHICTEKFTSPGQIIAYGGSAGGMVMGAVANMAPELFAGIVAEVPFVDVLNTILDADLPLTPPEWPEWGNPVMDKAAFDYIRSYSPYDNVKAQSYPAILALGGLSDPRVTYWEPAKWVAKLRATMTGGGPILLHTNMDAGHGGASGRFQALEETATVYTFAILAIHSAVDRDEKQRQ